MLNAVQTRVTHWVGLAALTFLLSFTVHPAVAETGDADAETFVRGLAESAVEILANPNASEAFKQEAFTQLVLENTDVEAIGNFTLGRYRRSATTEELQEFRKLFRGYTINFYGTRLGDFGLAKLDVTGSVNRNDQDVVVTSNLQLNSSGQPLSLNWRLRRSGEGYAIRDLEVVGVWLAIEQRSQFTSVIANNNGRFSALLDALRDKVARGETLSVNLPENGGTK